MQSMICSPTITLRRKNLAKWAGFVIFGILLTGCQQILDRLEIELKGSKMTSNNTSTLDERSLAEDSKPRTKKAPSNESTSAPVNIKTQNRTNPSTQKEYKRITTDTLSTTETQAREVRPSVSKELRVRSQVQIIDEDGNPFEGPTGTTKKKKTHVYIED